MTTPEDKKAQDPDAGPEGPVGAAQVGAGEGGGAADSPVDATDAEPAGVTDAESVDVTDAGPVDVTGAESAAATNAQPAAATKAEPAAATKAELGAATKAKSGAASKSAGGILGLDPETRAAIAAALGETHHAEEINDSIEDLIPTPPDTHLADSATEVQPADLAEEARTDDPDAEPTPATAEPTAAGGSTSGPTAAGGSTSGPTATSEPTASPEPAAAEAIPAATGEPTAAEPLAGPVAEPAEPVAEPTEAVAEAAEPGEVAGLTEAGEPVVEAAEPGEPQDEEGALPNLTEDVALQAALEALLLVIDGPADEESLADALDQPVRRVRQVLIDLAQQYHDQDRGIDLRNVGGGWRFHTRDKFAPFVEKLLLGGQRAKLTRAALESLAVIAYRQPVTRARVAAVRGVNVDGVVRTLILRGLIEEVGTDRETGGILYRTTELFLERLGLASLTDLPPIAPLLPEVDAIDDV